VELFEILPGKLYQSGLIDDWGVLAQKGISAVIDVHDHSERPQFRQPVGALYVSWLIPDGPLPDPTALKGLAGLGAALIRSGHAVLVHCAAGINRSSLVDGMILRELFPQSELPDLVGYLRARRPGALTNPNFAVYLAGV
jgi:protein-tyrosine phosphatase